MSVSFFFLLQNSFLLHQNLCNLDYLSSYSTVCFPSVVPVALITRVSQPPVHPQHIYFCLDVINPNVFDVV